MIFSPLGERLIFAQLSEPIRLAEAVRARRPEDMVEAILFLASERAAIITRRNLIVDGAKTARAGQPGVFDAYRKLLADAL